MRWGGGSGGARGWGKKRGRTLRRVRPRRNGQEDPVRRSADFDVPALTVVLGDPLVGGWVVLELDVWSIPFESAAFADAEGDIAEEDGFGEWGGVEEVGAWAVPWLDAEGGGAPFVPVVLFVAAEGEAFEELWWVADFLGFAEREDAGVVAVVAGYEETGLAADVDVAALGEVHRFAVWHGEEFLGDAGVGEVGGVDVLAFGVFEFAVVPVDIEGWAVFAVREFTGGVAPFDDGAEGELVVAVAVDFEDFDLGGEAWIHAHEDAVHGVAGHVGEGAAAEVVEAAPFEGMVDILFEGAHGGWPDPEVPVDVVGDGVFAGWAWAALRPDGAVGEAVDFGDIAEEAAVDEFVDAAVAVIGVALVAHLSGDLVFLGAFEELASFPDRVDEGFLGVAGLAGHEAEGSGHVVLVVRGGDDDGVVVLFLVEELAVVLVALSVFPCVEDAAPCVFVDFCEAGADIAGGFGGVDLGSGFTASGDEGEAEFVALVLGVENVESESAGGETGGLDEGSTRGVVHGIGILNGGVWSMRGRQGMPAGEEFNQAEGRRASGFFPASRETVHGVFM